MHDVDILKREHHRMLSDLNKDLRRNERKRRREQRRMQREYRKSLKCRSLPLEPVQRGVPPFVSRTFGFFLATLVLAVGVLL